MATTEERLAALEVRVAEHAQTFVDFREEGRLTRQLIDARFATMDARFSALDQKVDQGVTAIRRDMSADFRWLAGILITTMATVVATVIGVALAR